MSTYNKDKIDLYIDKENDLIFMFFIYSNGYYINGISIYEDDSDVGVVGQASTTWMSNSSTRKI